MKRMVIVLAVGILCCANFALAAETEQKQQSTSIVTVVFKPLTDFIGFVSFTVDALIEYFRPSNLHGVACDIMPSDPTRIPFKSIATWAQSCS